MTAAGWIMMVLTMGTVTAFTLYFFWMVLRKPQEKLPAETEKDAKAGE
jgi:hypothetical protein